MNFEVRCGVFLFFCLLFVCSCSTSSHTCCMPFPLLSRSRSSLLWILKYQILNLKPQVPTVPYIHKSKFLFPSSLFLTLLLFVLHAHHDLPSLLAYLLFLLTLCQSNQNPLESQASFRHVLLNMHPFSLHECRIP